MATLEGWTTSKRKKASAHSIQDGSNMLCLGRRGLEKGLHLVPRAHRLLDISKPLTLGDG